MSHAPPDNTREVSERHRFDEAKLKTWLRSEGILGKASVAIRQFRGGESNPTFWLSDGDQSLVLRKKPPGRLLPSAHAVEREYRVMRALHTSGVPVATMHTLCEDPNIIGTPFFVMDYVAGRIFWNVQLPKQPPHTRTAIYDELARVLAAIHAVDIDQPELENFGRRGGYAQRQVKRWSEQYRASETQTLATMDALIEWLPENLPKSDETTLAHGDYRLDNLIFHPTEPHCLAVIDWELSTFGHPVADLAYTCMLYNIQMPRVGGLLGIDFETTGIPNEPQFLENYCQRSGRTEIQDWPFFKAFSLFRLASIAQGVYKRSLQGNASSDNAEMYGSAVGLLSGIACQIVDLQV